MPRTTRAAARADGDTTSNMPQASEITAEPIDAIEAKAGKAKRGKTRKGKKNAVVDNATAGVVVAVDMPLADSIGNETQPSESTLASGKPVVMAAPEEQPLPPSPLRRSNRRQGQQLVVPTELEAEPHTAISIPSEQLASSPEPEEESPVQSIDSPQANIVKNGTLEIGSAHTPDAVQELQSIFERSAEADDAEDDSAISEIINKTPAKPTPSPRKMIREDPIEALDALEDALDEVGEFLPSAAKSSKKVSPAPPLKGQLSAKVFASSIINAPGSTIKAHTKPSAGAGGDASTVRRQASTKTVIKPAQTIVPAKEVAKRAPVVPRQPALSKSSTTDARPRSTPKLPSTKVSSGQTVTKTLSKTVSEDKERRPIVALQTPPPAVKSTKPLTKPAFQLPGEIMAAKLKALREERIKRQEAAAASAAENRVRTIGKPTATEVRQMAASVKRKSILTERNKNSDDGARGLSASIMERPLSLAPRMSSVAPRLSTAASRPKSMVLSSSVGGSATETRPRPTSIHGSQALSSTVRPRAAAPGGTAGRAPVRIASVSGKESANRAKLEQKSREQAIKDKAEAARKARAEAAERGRQASREWAEKMMMKKKSQAASAPANAPAAIVV